MYDNVKRSIRCGLIGVLALGALAGTVSAQEGEEAPDIQNVLLTFHLVQADGFTDEDPEISEVVSELRKIFKFKGYRLLSTSVFNIGLVRSSRGAYVIGDGLQRVFLAGSDAALTIKAEVSSRLAPPGTVRAKVTLTDATTRPTERSTNRSERLPLLEASATIRDGKTMIVGSPHRTADGPVLFLIVTPRIDP
ncbi:MAG: hypothetical protein OXG58_01690 [Gemmatimonadetes bacterium]|nr:hypothetical protein [Gemmatimonadota bacterium]MCY3942558.1 hypothetical protein [Gemmatimonadota bacterium]